MGFLNFLWGMAPFLAVALVALLFNGIRLYTHLSATARHCEARGRQRIQIIVTKAICLVTSVAVIAVLALWYYGHNVPMPYGYAFDLAVGISLALTAFAPSQEFFFRNSVLRFISRFVWALMSAYVLLTGIISLIN